MLEGVALVVEAVLAESEAIVAEVDDKGVVGQFQLIQSIEDSSDVLVEPVNGFAKVVVKLVEGGNGILVESPRLHVVDAMYAVPALLDPTRLRTIVFLGIGHSFGIVDGLAGIAFCVTRRGLERIVYRLVTDLEEEGVSFFCLSGDLIEP